MRLTDLSFEDWIEHAFSHEVRAQRAPWYFDPDHDWWHGPPVVAVAYLTRLFEEPEVLLRWFSDAQVAQGLTYLVSTSASGDSGWFYSTSVPTEDRVHCVEAVASLFAELFAPRCTPHLSHLSEAGAGPLNCVCYMWWDEFPCVALPDDPDLEILHDANRSASAPARAAARQKTHAGSSGGGSRTHAHSVSSPCRPHPAPGAAQA
jgi:hypothetical protein